MTGPGGYETLRYERAERVVVLTYDRPEQHNAVNRVMNRELHDAWPRFRDDDEAYGRTLEDRLRIEAEMIVSMFMRRDPHTLGAPAF